MSANNPKIQTPHYSMFDIAGPIMVGPSSSHTAGACKLGQLARALFHAKPDRVTFILHGSFATVYKGHATDRALVAGILRFKTSDPRLKHSFQFAKKYDIAFEFVPSDLGKQYHPNTVKIMMEKEGRKSMAMTGSSIGGGMVKVVKIDQFDVDLHGVAGQYKTLVVWHDNDKKLFKNLLKTIEEFGFRIHDVQTTEVAKHALSVINLDGRDLKVKEVLKLQSMPGMENVRSLTNLEP